MMAYSTSQVEAELSACIEPSQHPTKQQVWALVKMAQSSDQTSEKIQEFLYKRLAYPRAFHWREVEHTIVVIQQCSFVGPLKFVAFFKDRVYSIAALTNFQNSAATAVDNKRVQRKARNLLQLLQDESKLYEERGKCVAPNVARYQETFDWFERHSPWTPPSGQTPTPLRTEFNRNTAPLSSSSLPTPEPSPVRSNVRIEPKDEHDDDDFGADTATLVEPPREEVVEGTVRTATENTPSDVTREQMDDIALSTFDRYDLEVVISVLVERLMAGGEQQSYRHLSKALRIVDHCLRHGSTAFSDWFKEHRDMVVSLCTAPPVSAINRLARAVLNLLDEDSQEEGIPGMLNTPSSTLYHPTPPSPRSIVSDSESISLHEPVKDLTAFITTIDPHPIAQGGYSLVYKAKLSVGSSTEVVAKKVLNSHRVLRERLEKRLNREVRTWTRLWHINIAPFYGITQETNGSVGLISPFFENGNIVDYIKCLDKSQLDVLSMMRGIVAGVGYLHEEGVVHGDIKGSNIMVDSQGCAKLIDFGVSRVIGESGYTTSGSGISWAWAAPELLSYDDEPVTKSISSDVYAVAVTFVEVMTGRAPYSGMSLGAILVKFQQGEVPERPSPHEECNFYPGDCLWALLLCCWAPRPGDRPAISTIKEVLEDLADDS